MNPTEEADEHRAKSQTADHPRQRLQEVHDADAPHRPNPEPVCFRPRPGGGGQGVNLDVAHQRENGTTSIANIVPCIDGQGFPPTQSPHPAPRQRTERQKDAHISVGRGGQAAGEASNFRSRSMAATASPPGTAKTSAPQRQRPPLPTWEQRPLRPWPPPPATPAAPRGPNRPRPT